ncbi:hypothetical protein BC831DRAFT_453233 [Entophlyctis helioformis]|nr:hypothetical protein BC831DRAFT_453233 [Entophlyctis helioformis]
MWLKASGLLEHWKSQTTSAFYEDPKYGGIWSHAYTPDTILIHRLKNDSWFLAPSRHFMPQLMDASLLGYM